MKTKSIAAITTFGGSVAAAALPGARFTPTPGTPTGEWYRAQRKSPLNPPDSVFGPVWTTLYTLMTISAYRVWRAPASRSSLCSFAGRRMQTVARRGFSRRMAWVLFAGYLNAEVVRLNRD